MNFNEAALLPMAVVTPWSGWYTIGLVPDTKYTATHKKGMLVWSGASSIGSAAIQMVKLMGFTLYATASEKHHEYLKGLGASEVFDYKGEDVAGEILKTAKEDGLTLDVGFDAAGQTKECLAILKEFKGKGMPMLASAVPLKEDSAKEDGVKVRFISAPTDEKERTEFFHFVMRVGLKEKLEKGEFVPSPKIKVIDGGLESANKGLDELKAGVSRVKLVLDI